jgi:hypothetical protein
LSIWRWGGKTVMLMDDTSRTVAHAGIDTAETIPAVTEPDMADTADTAPDSPPPLVVCLRNRGAVWLAIAAATVAAGLGWIAADPVSFTGFQRLVAVLGAAACALAAVRFGRAAFDRRPKLVVDKNGVHDLRSRLTLSWADLRRAWVIESPGGAVLALEPVAGAGPFKRSLWQRLRQQDAALGFPQVTMSLSGLAYKNETLLAAIGERKPDAVLG